MTISKILMNVTVCTLCIDGVSASALQNTELTPSFKPGVISASRVEESSSRQKKSSASTYTPSMCSTNTRESAFTAKKFNIDSNKEELLAEYNSLKSSAHTAHKESKANARALAEYLKFEINQILAVPGVKKEDKDLKMEELSGYIKQVVTIATDQSKKIILLDDTEKARTLDHATELATLQAKLQAETDRANEAERLAAEAHALDQAHVQIEADNEHEAQRDSVLSEFRRGLGHCGSAITRAATGVFGYISGS